MRASELPAWVSERVASCLACPARGCPMKYYIRRNAHAFYETVKDPKARCPSRRWDDLDDGDRRDGDE